MVRCSDNTLYSGFSVDVQKRIETHNLGKGAKYTRARLPVKLVYYEEFDNKKDAMSREYAFKQLSKVQKEELIKNFKIKIQ